MLPKQDCDNSDPNNYRPISVNSCLGKIYERIINNRLYEHVEKNKILSIYQSGFRKHKSTKDNILLLTQKVAESFNRKKKYVAFFLIFRKHLIKYGGLVFYSN